MMKSAILFAVSVATLLVISSTTSVDAFALRSVTGNFSGPPPAPATVGISADLFNKVSGAAVPIINALAKNIVIPAISSKHFDVSPIHVDGFHLGPVTFGFSPAANGVRATVDLASISLSIPQTGFELKDKIVFVHVHCSGHLWASASLTGSISMDITETNGRLGIAGTPTASIDWRSLNIDHKMDHTFCKIMDKLVSLIANIDKIIRETIEKKLGPGIASALGKAVGDALGRLPFTVTGKPTAVDGAIDVPINLDSFIKQQKKQQQSVSASLGNKKVGAPARDLSVSVPSSSINTLLAVLKSDGKLIFRSHHLGNLTTTTLRAFMPEAYTLCPDCPLSLVTDAAPGAFSPTVSFIPNNASINVRHMTMAFGATNSSGAVSLFALNASAGFSVGGFSIAKNATYEVLHFDLGVNGIDLTVASSNVGKISGSTLTFLANIISTSVVSALNKLLYIPLPSTGFGVSDLQVNVTGGVFKAGVNVDI